MYAGLGISREQDTGWGGQYARDSSKKDRRTVAQRTERSSKREGEGVIHAGRVREQELDDI